MPKFGIIAALEREVAPFARRCVPVERIHSGRKLKVFERGETVLVCGGIGREAARRATESLIALYQPSIVQSVGYAGALTPALRAGTIVRPARVTDATDGSSVETGSGSGVLLTSSSIASTEQKARFARVYRADAVDMEASAVARGAEARGVRFAALKAISDTYDFEMPPTERFVTSEGQFQSARFAWYAALRPWLWGSVFRLARNSTIASRALGKVLEAELVERSRQAVPST